MLLEHRIRMGKEIRVRCRVGSPRAKLCSGETQWGDAVNEKIGGWEKVADGLGGNAGVPGVAWGTRILWSVRRKGKEGSVGERYKALSKGEAE